MTSLFGLQALRDRFERRYLDHCGFGSGREYLTKIIASLGTGDLLLDAGCGEGSLRQQLPPTVHYVGLDRYAGKQSNEYTDWNMRPSVLGDVHPAPFRIGHL